MKILFYGAGVIGCIYAAKLWNAGNDVTLLARGERSDDLEKHGIVLHDAITNRETVSRVPLVRCLNREDFYDLIVVTVRLDQLSSILPALRQNSKCPLIMFMLNNPDNIAGIRAELKERTILQGFPGAGGTRDGNRIRYIQIKQQKTTIGAGDTETASIAKKIKKIFEGAGFTVAISRNMEVWLKIHAIFVSCAAASILLEGGDSIRLGRNKQHVVRMVKSVREGFKACRSLGVPVVPFNLRMIFLILPVWISVAYWQKALQGKIGTLSIEPHAKAAKEEMVLLAEKVLRSVCSSLYPVPALDHLLTSFVDKFHKHKL